MRKLITLLGVLAISCANGGPSELDLNKETDASICIKQIPPPYLDKRSFYTFDIFIPIEYDIFPLGFDPDINYNYTGYESFLLNRKTYVFVSIIEDPTFSLSDYINFHTYGSIDRKTGTNCRSYLEHKFLNKEFRKLSGFEDDNYENIVYVLVKDGKLYQVSFQREKLNYEEVTAFMKYFVATGNPNKR